jgi:ABC-2 type transport system ATP-binding protein
MTPAINIENLTKDFPFGFSNLKLRAVDNLSLKIRDNQVFGLLGPNGSGKSTTIKVILGLLAPTVGKCEIFGVSSNNVQSRRDVGFLPEAPYFYRYLTGFEMVKFFAKVCGVEKKILIDRVHEVIEWVGLREAANRRVGTYSKGMLQRIGLAQAIVHNPRLIILDEPTAGVDPVGSAEISELILKLKREGKTVLLCSHLLAQVEDICDHVAILNRGKLILEGELNQLVGRKGLKSLIVENLSDEAAQAAARTLSENGARLVNVEQPQYSLDRVFLDHVSQAENRRSVTSSQPKNPEEKKGN